jgi:GAF domain-containing protein
MALAGEAADSLLEHAAIAISGTLEAAFVSVLEAPADGDDLTARFAIPEAAAPVGRLSRPFRSHAVYTLRSQRPVIVNDFELERRFGRGPLDGERSARCGVCVPIPGVPQAVGVLCAHWTEVRPLGDNEVSFLQSMANVCGLVLQRERIEAELNRLTSGG